MLSHYNKKMKYLSTLSTAFCSHMSSASNFKTPSQKKKLYPLILPLTVGLLNQEHPRITELIFLFINKMVFLILQEEDAQEVMDKNTATITVITDLNANYVANLVILWSHAITDLPLIPKNQMYCHQAQQNLPLIHLLAVMSMQWWYHPRQPSMILGFLVSWYKSNSPSNLE